MRWVVLPCVLAAGCMQDADGRICRDSPPWISDGMDTCPAPGDADGDDSVYRTYAYPSAIETAGGARIAMRTREGDLDEVVITTLDYATGTVGPLVTVPGTVGVPRLAGNDNGTYLTWFDGVEAFGATLGSDSTLGDTFSYGPSYVSPGGDSHLEPFAIDDRFLVVEYDDRYQQARWIDAEGNVGAPFPFPGRVDRQGVTAAGAGFAATMYLQDGGLFIARTNGATIELARQAGLGSLAIDGEGAILAAYGRLIRRIAPDGSTSEQAVASTYGARLLGAGPRVYWIEHREDSAQDQYVIAELDPSGILREPTTELVTHELRDNIMIAIEPVGDNVFAFSQDHGVELVRFDGERVGPVRVAESYAIDDGCNSGRGTGLALGLALAGLRRRRTR